jgi:hypothetical protein
MFLSVMFLSNSSSSHPNSASQGTQAKMVRFQAVFPR